MAEESPPHNHAAHNNILKAALMFPLVSISRIICCVIAQARKNSVDVAGM